MALARKPKPNAKAQSASDEGAIEALIAKGGSVAEDSPKEKDRTVVKPTNVVLRLPPEMLSRVDVAVEARSVRIPRHTWLLEAVLEKLDREQAS